jgi:erythromycin esterase-like protein
MPATLTRPNVELLHDAARSLRGLDEDFDPLLEMIGDSPCVPIGEASHGTHEFYETRAIEPLDPPDSWHGGEPPETFPTGV